MKKLTTFLLGAIIIANSWAQSPEKISYQAVVHNSDNQLITSQTIGIKISIIRGSVLSGTIVYTEIQTPQTNSNGLISIEIGQESNFSTIDWANGPYFIKTETDPTGGTNYSITGTSQLLSVPYALHAKTAETVTNLELTGNETAFNNWDKDSSDDFDGQYNSLSGAPTNVSDFSNDAGYIATETDPIFSASQASNITSAEITKLNNLSGVNTGDQDLTSLATKSALEDTAAAIRNDFKNVSGEETDPIFTASQASNITSAEITKLNNLSGVNTGDQDLTSLATKSELQAVEADIRSDIPEIDGSETHVTAGTNVTVTGTGTSGDPYEISASVSGSSASHFVGEIFGGGVVYYVDGTGEHGLIASLTDQSTNATWENYRVTGATSSWDGSTNTEIVASGAPAGCAVLLATAHRGGGHDDWYLPAIDELVMLANARYAVNKTLHDIPGATELTYLFYWSSTEYSIGQAYVYRFNYLRASYEHKELGADDSDISVRAIREF